MINDNLFLINMRWKIYLSCFITGISVIIIGLLVSWKSIPNQEGYFELSWNLTYLNFKETILNPQVTPLNFLLPYLLVKLFHLSLLNSWKILDLVFGGFTAAFIVRYAILHNNLQHLKEMIKMQLLLISSVGAIYPLTSMTGEGLSVFVCLLGVHAWLNYSFMLGALFFSLAILSKYTIYLILPGIILWTVVNWSKFDLLQKRNIILSLVFFLGIFLVYNNLKSWGDITGQAGLSSSFKGALYLLPYFIIALILSAPIIIILSFLSPDVQHLMRLVSLSALLVLLTRHFYWHYPYQVIPFLTYFVVSKPNLVKLIKYRYIVFQIILTLCIYILLPLKVKDTTIFPKHNTFSDLRRVEIEINKSYHGGKIGYYGNRPFDEPFPAYEISYMDPSWRFQMEQTEYVVLPSDFIPPLLGSFSGCELTWLKTINLNAIYKVACQKAL